MTVGNHTIIIRKKACNKTGRVRGEGKTGKGGGLTMGVESGLVSDNRL